MSSNNITVIVALITTFAAIVSPLLTAIVNNRHQLKMKKIEIYQIHKIKAIENYLNSAGGFLSTLQTKQKYDYYSSLGEAYLYAPKKSWELIDKLTSEINSQNYVQARETFNLVSRELSKYIEM